ncbi:MAG: leucine-rich repeat domain-containing protein, partial [Muribaculaceae bacterium]|nr:leucine-rich repeat domain-containing protein [Muribaculaceae bacterium]
MRKIYLKLSLLIISLIALVGGGVNLIPHIVAQSSESIPGVDLSEYYVLKGDNSHIYSVTYKTKSQSGMHPKEYNASDGLRLYLIPKSEEPTSVSIEPAIRGGVTYGIKSIIDENGKDYNSTPRLSSINVSNMTPGVVVNITTDEIDNILTGTLTVNVKDNPSRVNLYYAGSAYSIKYNVGESGGKTMTIKYDPKTENKWIVYGDTDNKLFIVKLDGVKQTRAYVTSPIINNGMISMLNDFSVTLDQAKTNHTIDVTADVIDMQVPMKFECEQTTGNETNPEYLQDMISSVTVSGVKTYTDKEWTKEGFTVPNGKSVYVTIKPQVRGQWEVLSAFFNHKKLSSSGSYMSIEAESPTETQIYTLYGKYNSRLRYTFNLPDLEHTIIREGGSKMDITSSPYNGTTGITSSYFKPLGTEGYKVYDVTVDGKTRALDEDGCFRIEKQDEVITITPRKYERNIPIKIYSDCSTNIGLDPNGPCYKNVEIKEGLQTVNVHAEDLPMYIWEGYEVYLNGKKITAHDVNGNLAELANLSANDVVSIYSSTPRKISLTHSDFPSGVSATIYHNGNPISGPGQYTVLPGTVIKYVPTQGDNLVLQSGTTIYPAAADGSFEIPLTGNNVSSYMTISLHPRNPEVKISAETPSGVKARVKGGIYSDWQDLTSTPETFYLDYNPSSSTGSLSFSTSDVNYNIASITASPAGSFKYDSATKTATGIADGMTLTVKVAQSEYKYPIDLSVAIPSSDWVFEEGESWGGGEPPYLWKQGNGQTPYYPLRIGFKGAKISSDGAYFEDGSEYVTVDWGITNPLMEPKNKFAPNFTRKGLNDEDFPLVLIFQGQEDYSYGNNEVIDVSAIIGGKVYPFEYVEIPNDYGFTMKYRKLVIEEPCALVGSIIDANLASSSYNNYGITIKACPAPYFYSVNGGSEVEVPAGKEVSISVPYSSQIDFRSYDGSDLSIVSSDSNGQYGIMGEEPIVFYNGKYHFRVRDYDTYGSEYDYSGSTTFTITPPKATVQVTSDCDSFNDSNIIIGGVTTPGDGSTVELTISPTISVKCADSDYRVIGAIDKNSGQSLEVDAKNGLISGVKAGMHLDLKTEKIERNRTFKLAKNGYFSSFSKMILGEGTPFERSINLKNISSWPYTVSYNEDELPVKFDCALAKNSVSTSYITPVTIYIGQEEVSSSKLPSSLPEGVTILLSYEAYLCDVTYDIDEDLDITVTENGVRLTDFNGVKKRLPLTYTSIAISENPNNKFDFSITEKRSNGYTTTYKPGEAFTLAAKGVRSDITVAKTYNTVTIAAGEGTNLSDLTIVGSDDVTYVPDASGNIMVPTRVKELTITSSAPESFFSDGVTTGDMKFDLMSGVLSDLSTGTLTISTKKIERDKEVSIYVDGNDFEGTGLDGAKFTLGSGKSIETGQGVAGGSQTLQFGDDDLPIILTLPDSFTEGGVSTDKLPTVYVNGEKLEYSQEKGGFIFPESAFSYPNNPPVIKIYPAPTDPVEVSYLIEPGITFKAVTDGDEATALTEAGSAMILPGTPVVMTAVANKSNENIFVEVAGQTVTEGHSVNYEFTVGSMDQTIEVKRRKVAVTFNNSDQWENIRINGAGFTYPMYAESSELEFPEGTTQLTLRSTADDMTITGVKNNGTAMNYDVVTGVLSGVADNMKLTIETGPMTRDKQLTIYLDDSVNTPQTIITLAKDKAIEKEVKLAKGYQTVSFADADLPLSFNGGNFYVYLNNEEVKGAGDGSYNFPTSIPTGSVMKIYGSAQPLVEVRYAIEAVAFNAEVKHDQIVVDHTQAHKLLPGTEIAFSIEYLNPAMAKMVAARRAAARAAAAAGDAFNPEDTEVTVNGEPLVPEEDGTFKYKVDASHASTGLKFVVKRPDYVDETTGFTLSYDRKTLVAVSSTVTDPVSIPEGITTIGEGAFKDRKDITEVIFPTSLTEIEREAFAGSGIKSVTVPDNVTSIGEGAFSGCTALTSVVLGKGLTEVGEGAFEGCDKIRKSMYPEGLGKSPFPASVPAVPYNTEDELTVDVNGFITTPDKDENGNVIGVKLVFVPVSAGSGAGENGTYTIPDGVTSIGAGAFAGCDNITKIVVPETSQLKSIGAGAFEGCGNLSEVDLSASKNLTEIGEGAFKGTSITEITLPESLEKIGGGAFEGTKITSVVVPDNVKEIGEGAFKGCSELETVKVGKNVETIGGGTFEGCEKLTEVNLSENKTLTEIGEGAFKGTSITEITLPDSLEKIGGGAFEGTKITSVVVPDNVKEIGEGAFKGCDELETVKVGKNVETIGGGSFEGCKKLTEVDLSETENLKEIGEGAFKGSSITDIELPETLEKIGGGAFEGTKITSVVVPDNVKEIGEGAFKGCDELETVVLGNGLDPEKVGKDLFEGSENLSKVVVPDTVKEVIGETLPDGTKEIVYNHEEEVEILDNGMVVSKGKDAEGNETKTLVSVPVDTTDENLEFPEGLTSIGGGAFAGCDKITEVKVPDTVKEIGEGAFKGTSLTTITLPDSLEKIGGGAFEGTDLTTVVVPDNVKEIGEGAFKGCSELKTVVLGNGLEEVGENAFEGCDGLGKSLYPETLGKSPFPDTVPAVPYDPEDELEIDENGYITAAEKDEEGNVIGKKLVLVPTTAGNGEDGEEKGTFTLPDGITSIGSGAFAGCDNITKVVVPETSDLKTIGKGAFEGCDKLTEVDLSESKNLKEIGEGAFKGTSITDIELPDSLEKIGGGAFEGTDLKTVVVP